MELEQVIVCCLVVRERLVPASGIPSPVDARVIEPVADVGQVAGLLRIVLLISSRLLIGVPGENGARSGWMVLTA